MIPTSEDRMRSHRSIPLAASLALAVTPLLAQDSAQGPEPLAIGATAPDFVLPGPTRFGVLAHPVRLSDFRGKTVVISFFYKARTKG
jgi:hypothetical protein